MTHKDSKRLWSPSPQSIQNAQVTSFINTLNKTHNLSLKSWHDLWDWSVEHSSAFWSSLWDFLDIIGTKGARIITHEKCMPGAQFFPDASLNYAENCLRYGSHDPALHVIREEHPQPDVSFDRLREDVSAFANFLRARDVKKGDRIAVVLPNGAEAVVALLAAASLGVIFSSCSPDFASSALLDRLGQINPKLLVVCASALYRGKTISFQEKAEQILLGLPSLQDVVVVSKTSGENFAFQNISSHTWEDILKMYSGAPLTFERLPFSHPLVIVYSSGTTGKPKCIVHSAGGVLLQHMKEHQLHCNLRRKEKILYYTTCGWMMWNWLVTGLASGITLCLYEGAPHFPHEGILFDTVDHLNINVLGVSGKLIDLWEKSKLKPRETHILKELHTILSTGSPLLDRSFDYVYRDVKKDVMLASISGGTDILSCFVLGAPTIPVFRGEIQSAGLGLAVNVFAQDKPEALKIGEKGELVCTKPFPAMPVGFWQDEEDKKYHHAYFKRYNNIWHHGDFCAKTPHNGFVIYGRSDSTLNPGGVRIGTAEIYAHVEKMPQIQEALAIGQHFKDDERIILFVILSANVKFDDSLDAQIKNAIRHGASARHVPECIVPVPDFPRTRSGKISEIIVRDLVNHREPQNIGAIANPDVLVFFKDRAELHS